MKARWRKFSVTQQGAAPSAFVLLWRHSIASPFEAPDRFVVAGDSFVGDVEPGSDGIGPVHGGEGFFAGQRDLLVSFVCSVCSVCTICAGGLE